jgi:hypothetical protein
MARRITDELGRTWDVAPSGRVTQYDIDQLSLEFTRIDGDTRERRFARYAPRGARIGELAFEQTSDAALLALLRESQVSWTSPDGGYAGPA